MGNVYSIIRAIAWAKEHWYHAVVSLSVPLLTGSFAVSMACGTFRKCDHDPCGLPVKKSFFDEPACDYWEHGGDSMIPTRKRALRGTTITVINGMKGWGGLNQTGYSYDEVPGVTIHSSNDIEDGGGLSSFGEGPLGVTIPGDKLPDWIWITNAGEAPICIAGVHLTAPDGSQITMTGNLGRLCGADHYESASEVLPNGEGKPAACIWVDRHGSNGLRLPGIAFDLQNHDSEDGPDPEFYNITSVHDLCQAPFIMLQGDQPALSRRQLVAPSVARDDSSVASLDFDSALVKSNLDLSSAVQMCRGEFTKGPHFVSLSEGLYCDMSTRQLYPVCKDDADHDGETCFDVEQNELVESDSGEDDLASRKGLVERDPENQTPRRVKVLKTFRYVDTWN